MRLFFAIELDTETTSRLIDFQARLTTLEARPVAPSNFHITLSFLGESEDRQLDLILDQLQAPAIKPFEIATLELVYWPRPKILALEILDPQKQLLSLKKDIESQLNRLGIRQYDRKSYSPHITLFRKVEKPPKQGLEQANTITVRHLSLMWSQNTRSGVNYERVHDWPLAGLSVKQQLLGR